MPKKDDADADVELAKKIAQVQQIRRKARLASIKDHMGFFVSQGVGLISLVGGIIGEVAPTLLPHTLNSPTKYIAVGLTLLLGKEVVTVLAKVANALKP
jgi:hypothetical protein